MSAARSVAAAAAFATALAARRTALLEYCCPYRQQDRQHRASVSGAAFEQGYGNERDL